MPRSLTSEDGRIQIFVANIFSIPIHQYGMFDVVWDRRSFTAINKADHLRYRNLLFEVMKPDSVCYLNTVEYDVGVWPGPPHSISDEYVTDLFGSIYRLELLEENNDKSINPNEPTSQNDKLPSLKSDEERTDPTQKRSPSPTHVAIGRSSFIFDRWYKLMPKQ